MPWLPDQYSVVMKLWNISNFGTLAVESCSWRICEQRSVSLAGNHGNHVSLLYTYLEHEPSSAGSCPLLER